MRMCSVLGCGNENSKHFFPRNPKKRHQWIKLTGASVDKKCMYICDKHFKPCDITGNGAIYQHVFPSLNLPNSPTKASTSVKKRYATTQDVIYRTSSKLKTIKYVVFEANPSNKDTNIEENSNVQADVENNRTGPNLEKISVDSVIPKSSFNTLHKYNYSTIQNNPGTSSNVDDTTFRNLQDIEVNRIVWIDMEMTGLDIEKDKIMEIACIITDSDLNIIAEAPNFIIKQPSSILDQMDEWCTKQHKKSGLTDACLNSNITLEEAENVLYEFVEKFIAPNQSPLAGNSVYMDRLFLRKFMPKLDSYLHYRIIDVSTIKELCRRWNPELYKNVPKKVFSHRAVDDIKESIEEMRFYKENFLKTNV